MNGRRIFGMSSGQFTIAFNRNGTISGIGACNRFSGTYTSFGRGSVSIRPGGMTRISCPNMSLENEFIMVLSRANGYRIHSNRMMLLSHGRVIAVLTRRW